MCGRFTLSISPRTLAQLFRVTGTPPLPPRYNIAPTQQVPAVRVSPQQQERELVLLRWGLVPGWAKDPGLGAKLINARAETVLEKPAFRGSFRHKRCLVPADGFYEWQHLGNKKQPLYIRLRDGRPFAFAGLWDHWEGPEGSVIDSCTILTTGPNELLRPIHDRMPVILDPKDYEMWLDPGVQNAEQLQSLFHPYPAAEMVAYPVGLEVNNPRNDGPQCIEPLPMASRLPLENSPGPGKE